MIRVRGGQHWSGQPLGTLTDLGLCQDQVKVEYERKHQDVLTDSFADMPADVRWQAAGCKVKMTLIHFDSLVLKCCLSDSMAGGGQRRLANRNLGLIDVQPGRILKSPGARLGNGLPRLASGNYFVGLNVAISADFGNVTNDLTDSTQYQPQRLRFLHCYLAEQPVVYPLGSECSAVELTWRAVPYAPVWTSGTNNNDSLARINAGTNNGPAWAGQSRAIDLPQDGAFAVTPGVPFALQKEVLFSGCAIWDHGKDGV